MKLFSVRFGSRSRTLSSRHWLRPQQVAHAYRARTSMYMWHISNFYIIPSMNRNLMNGTFQYVVRSPFHPFMADMYVLGLYNIQFGFFLYHFDSVLLSFGARDTQNIPYIQIYFMCVQLHRHPFSSVFVEIFHHHHQHFSHYLSLMLCIFISAPQPWQSEKRE